MNAPRITVVGSANVDLVARCSRLPGPGETIGDAAFGKLLLGIVAAGLLGYAAWRVIAAVMDAENKGDDAKGLATRAAGAARGLLYVGLALQALQLMRGTGSSASPT